MISAELMKAEAGDCISAAPARQGSERVQLGGNERAYYSGCDCGKGKAPPGSAVSGIPFQVVADRLPLAL